MKRCIFAIAPLLFAGCESKKSCEQDHSCNLEQLTAPHIEALQEANTNHTTANELLRALKGQAFTVVLPDDLPKEFYAGLVIQHFDGKVVRSGRMTFSNKNKKLRVLLFHNSAEKRYDYSILSETAMFQNGLPMPEYRLSVPAPLGRTVKPNEGMLRFGQDRASSEKTLQFEGNFEIALQITPVE